VALGTNFNPGASSTYSMPAIIALACANVGMSPAEAICAATFNAACAIGSGAVAGSLEVGKPADLIVLNASDYREIPYHFGVNLVNRTVKRGVTIYQEGRVALR
jgi:imidazolonepropionase